MVTVAKSHPTPPSATQRLHRLLRRLGRSMGVSIKARWASKGAREARGRDWSQGASARSNCVDQKAKYNNIDATEKYVYTVPNVPILSQKVIRITTRDAELEPVILTSTRKSFVTGKNVTTTKYDFEALMGAFACWACARSMAKSFVKGEDAGTAEKYAAALYSCRSKEINLLNAYYDAELEDYKAGKRQLKPKHHAPQAQTDTQDEATVVYGKLYDDAIFNNIEEYHLVIIGSGLSVVRNRLAATLMSGQPVVSGLTTADK